MKEMRVFALLIVMALVLSTLAACSNSTAPSSSGATPSQLSENIRDANEPSELIGAPDHIYIVKGENERMIEPDSDEYSEVIVLLSDCFPEKLKEASRAILWADENGFNWDMMCEQFDFIRLSYDTMQTVQLNCMNKDDYPIKEISFETMVFPLSDMPGCVSIDTHKTDSLVGRSYGPLDMPTELIEELLGYAE